MKENVLKAFWKETYQTRSPIPFIISALILIFVLIHFFDLLVYTELIDQPLYDDTVRLLSLPQSGSQFIRQPWSLFTYPLIHTGLFQLLFDCLCLYWVGSMFLNFLHVRQFLFLFFSSILVGGIAFLALAQIPYLAHSIQHNLTTASLAIASLMAAVATLLPALEVKLLLIGRINMKNIALIYLGLEFIFLALVNRASAVALLITSLWGWWFIHQLQRGKDYSKQKLWMKKQKLKVVKSSPHSIPYQRHAADLPNQQQIDSILDKISTHGYDSLSPYEKEILFKASKDHEQSQ